MQVSDIKQMLSDVVTFNTIMGNSLDNKDLISTYESLTKEEFFGKGEFKDSYIKGDLEGQLDGLCDLVYTCGYWALLEGYNLENNVGTALDFTDNTFLSDDIKDLEYSINEGLSAYALNNLITILSKKEVTSKFDIVGAFNEVKRSNLSKFVPAESVDIDEEVTYIESVGRYADISVEEIETEDGVLLAFKAGKDLQNNVTFKKPKLIKTRNFSEPQLEQFIL